ncbi:PH domain-containing protein [Bombardia bombarda]|uniref:PH domain-containing protein n=1 Tax=Bombardia bombarda TaxID=252184 RepID=A0AA40C1C6_9PEZI|nr:PH domain-containing protein [Bombardia bombarda]
MADPTPATTASSGQPPSSASTAPAPAAAASASASASGPSSTSAPAAAAAAAAAASSSSLLHVRPQPRAGSAIPVGLNEAALDSPTFRAVTAHFSDQLDGIERWLDGYVRSTSKVVHDVLALEDTINTYLSKMTPPPPPPPPSSATNSYAAISASSNTDAVLDADYTLLALRRASDGARDWWAALLATVRRLEPVSAEPIRAFLSGELRSFKETRRALEGAQKSFDSTLARYVGQSKTKEPSALREDAFNVFEARKAYLKASMDFCQMAPQLRYSLDKLLVRELERIRGWSKEMESSEAVFRRELQMARRDIGESTLVAYKPSRELEDYSVSTVPYLVGSGSSRGPMSSVQQRKDGQGGAVISEKQGWLFLRVMAGKPNLRTTWVRRWYYCRNGIFGWLVQGPQGVLQGDEIGVLLCSAKPAVQEERRFCFEVKTKAQSLLLQAETQTQLMEWLEVFEVAKKDAFEASVGRDHSALVGGVDPAFSITPASIPEFSAKMLESVDEQGGSAAERIGTSSLPVPGGQDGNLASRAASFDISNNPPRRSLTTLGREDGESGRDHAARIMQKLDLHRKATFANATDNAPASAAGAGGIASLITAASQNLIAGYTSPQSAAQRQPNPHLTTPVQQHPGSLAPATLAKPPIPTSLSKAAILASATTDSSRSLPSAVLANYWGSNPWMSLYSSRPEGLQTLQPNADDPFVATALQPRTPALEQTPIVSAHRKTVSVDTKVMDTRSVEKPPAAEVFPRGYPPELRAQYAQFRLVFPTAPLEEKPVLVFSAAWSSSSGEGREGRRMAGNGRIFVTPDNMYFYGHQMGLVIAYTISLDDITEVTAAPGKDCDFIFLHLSQALDDTGFSRITIKVFLEDFSLLHSRLNLLIDDLQAEEPMDLPEIISALVSLEREQYDRKSPSAESWEEVSSNTPIDDGTPFGRPVSKRVRDLVGRYRSPRGLRKPPPKVQLPTHAVVYEPEDMGRPVAERQFELSAKACFHVLFGDKSFIFPKLYFERRAKEIAQGPWELQDHGTMKREFKFKVDNVDMLGRSKAADVTDTQTIDIFNDHITYVVTHIKTPWHLPHSNAFKLVTKVVITHVTKSRCKLAVFTKVDWSKAPAFAKSMVQRQALGDAANDAEELAEVATDQVRKLGPHSRTKRAIQVYGNIGHQTQVVVFAPAATGDGADGARKAPIRPRTLTDMLVETGRSFMESAITSVMMWAFAAVRRLFKIVTANRLILVLLALSAAYNVIVVSQSSSAWWAERRAAKYMSRIGVGPNLVMSKAIYIADLEEAAQGSSVGVVRPVGSQCYDTFQAIVNTTDPDAPYTEAGRGFMSSTSKATARRLRRTRQRLGSYRHDLLVAMRVVNGIETEMLQSEWENWLADEGARCEQARTMLHLGEGEGQAQGQAQSVLKGDVDDGEGGESEKKRRRDALQGWYEEYCGSCESDQRALVAGGGGLRGRLL